jgi:hypothetical protein
MNILKCSILVFRTGGETTRGKLGLRDLLYAGVGNRVQHVTARQHSRISRKGDLPVLQGRSIAHLIEAIYQADAEMGLVSLLSSQRIHGSLISGR